MAVIVHETGSDSGGNILLCNASAHGLVKYTKDE